jgi:uncharacterized coiled-coil DUF342 family protein
MAKSMDYRNRIVQLSEEIEQIHEKLQEDVSAVSSKMEQLRDQIIELRRQEGERLEATEREINQVKEDISKAENHGDEPARITLMEKLSLLSKRDQKQEDMSSAAIGEAVFEHEKMKNDFPDLTGIGQDEMKRLEKGFEFLLFSIRSRRGMINTYHQRTI